MSKTNNIHMCKKHNIKLSRWGWYESDYIEYWFCPICNPYIDKDKMVIIEKDTK